MESTVFYHQECGVDSNPVILTTRVNPPIDSQIKAILDTRSRGNAVFFYLLTSFLCNQLRTASPLFELIHFYEVDDERTGLIGSFTCKLVSLAPVMRSRGLQLAIRGNASTLA